MTEKRFNIEFDGHQYFLVIDEDNERCLARLDTRIDALAWLEIYKMLSEENEQLKHQLQQQEMEYATTCNRLAEENEQLKRENELLSDELEQCKAVIDNRWKEYLDKKGDVE